MPFPVIWKSPGNDARDSMPLGNGDIGINAWVDPAGDLLFYIGKTDAWEDNARLAKVGLIRVRLSPSLLTSRTHFLQELHPGSCEIIITTTDKPETPDCLQRKSIRLWVDANHPTIHIDVESTHPVTAVVSFELWRTEPTPLPSIEVGT